MNSDRIVELETKVAFQEKTLEELNTVIYKQQIQLDRLEKYLIEMGKTMKGALESSTLGNAENEKPPHY